MLSNEKKHQIFLKLRTENYQASLRLEGLNKRRSVVNKNESAQSEEKMSRITHAIHDDADYKVALKKIESLMAAEIGTPEGNQLEVLISLIEAYEAKYSMD